MPRILRSVLVTSTVAAFIAGCGGASEPAFNSIGAQATSSSASPPPAPPRAAAVQATPVIASVIAAPVPVPATDGKVHLAYELQLINALGGDVTLKSVSARAGDVDDQDGDLLTLAGGQLSYWTRALGAGTVPTAVLHPGQAGIVWLDVVLDRSAPVPTELSHTIVVDLADPMPPLLPATMTENAVAPVRVSERRPAVISPPLRGPGWLDGNSCCDMTAHRMAMNPLDGNLWAAERFAIDYLQLSPDGTIFTGASTNPETTPTSAPTSTPSQAVPSSPCSTVCPSRSRAAARRDCRSNSTGATTSCRTSPAEAPKRDTPSTRTSRPAACGSSRVTN